MPTQTDETEVAAPTFFGKMMRFWMNQKLMVFIALIGLVTYGLVVAPFDWDIPLIPRDPVPVDAIPDIGENQQIVFTTWTGRSPRDVEDQITYPLTVSLLGIPGVKSIRSYSYFGFSTIYVVFEDRVDFYWSRTRILERLNSLQPGTLPSGVQPVPGTGRDRSRPDILVHGGGGRVWIGRAQDHSGLVCAVPVAIGQRGKRSGLHRRLCQRVPGRCESQRDESSRSDAARDLPGRTKVQSGRGSPDHRTEQCGLHDSAGLDLSNPQRTLKPRW